MPVRNLVDLTPTYWVPPIYTANWKITVTRADGTVDDITDIITKFKVEDGVTEGIGIFEFTIPNPNETYTNVWTGMEVFRYYKDYAAAATTLRFRGRVEKPSNKNNELTVTGRSETLFVIDQNVTKSYVGVDVGYIIKDIFDSYGGGRFDTSGINVSTGVTLTITFSDLAFWDVVESVCTAAGYDCYVDCNLVVKFFVQGSITNTDEGIVHDHNLVEVGDFAPDLQFVKNKIRVVGGQVDGVQVTNTANDAASQTANGIRMEVINDDGIVTMAAAKELADFLLNDRKNAPTVGEVRGIMLATIQPGEKIRISSPMENIPPGAYRTVHYRDESGEDGAFTTVTINKEPRKVSHVIKDRIQREHKKTDSTGNPNDLDFAEIELFNSSTGSLSQLAISDGTLHVSTGYTQGTWTSAAWATSDGRNVDQMRMGVVGDGLSNVRIRVSANNGLTFDDITRDELKSIAATGKSIKVELTLTGSTTQVDSVKIQYSTKS